MGAIAIIPARGGSQRIPKKNIKAFYNKPIIGWTVEGLLASNIFERIVVSTDDEDIAAVARQYGAEVPFLRNKVLGEDRVPTIDVVVDAIDNLDLENNDLICTVYPTNPMLQISALKLSSTLLQLNNYEGYVTTVVRYGFPVQRSLIFDSNKKFKMQNMNEMYSFSQDLEPIFHETGQFWLGKAATWRNRTGMQEVLRGIELPEILQQDIDTESDWALAEAKFQLIQGDPFNVIDVQALQEFGLNKIIFH